jgi:uncharacterized protein YciI
MLFVLIARDGEDKDAMSRRMASRPGHLSFSTEAIKRGEQIFGGALLSEDGQMKGSMMLVDFPSRVELDEWLKVEPYMTGNVWKNIEIIPFRQGPSFDETLKRMKFHDPA